MAAWEQPRVDPAWWSAGSFGGRSLPDILRGRDVAAVFGFLGARGWSRAAIGAATGLSETRVRGIVQGKQRITSYEVLERIADGLQIDRGLLGLGYTHDPTGDLVDLHSAPVRVGREPAVKDTRLDAESVSFQPAIPSNGLGAHHRVGLDDEPDKRRVPFPRASSDPVAGTTEPPERDQHHPYPAQARSHNLSQLPPDISDFTGRSDAAAELARLLTSQSAGVAVVVSALSGKGGIGKTTLAVHVAHRVRPFFPDGQLYVDLRGAERRPADPSHVLGRFLNELGFESGSIPDQMDDRARLYRAQLAERRLLVVLDNAFDERQVRPLLPGTAGCAVVVTSRKRLIGLAGAQHVPLEVMTAEQGLGLLGAVVGESRIDAEPEAARDIVHLCGRLPLAIRIAGARVASRPRDRLAVFTQRLRDEHRRLDLLTAGDLEVRTTFALSYQGCDAKLQRAFRLLGILETPSFAPWTLALLADIGLAQAEELLERLVDSELLEISASGGSDTRRYRFHDLLRVYARECLLEAESSRERSEAAKRLLREYVRVGVNAAAVLEPGGLEQPVPAMPAALAALQDDPRGWLRAERAAFVTGARLAVDLEFWELAWRLAELLPALFRWQSDWTELEQTLTLGLDAAQRGVAPDGEARIRCSLGLLYRAQGRFADAIAELGCSAKIFREIGDELRSAVAQRQLGDTYRYTGRLHDGLALFAESLQVFERERSTRMTAGTLNGLGDIYRGLSRWDDSVDCFERCIELYESLHDELEVARARVRFGILYRDRCLYEEAETLFSRGLDALRDQHDQRWQARALRHLGIVHRNTGRTATALEHFSQCLGIFTELADHRGIAVTLRNTGDAHRYAGEIDLAEERLSEALIRFRDLGDERWQARTLVGISDTIRHHSRWAEATAHLDTALGIYQHIDDVPGQARVMRSFGIVHRARKRWQDSLQAFERSEALFASLGDQVWQARAVAGRAATQQARGDDSWRQLRGEAERLCRAAGAGSEEQVGSWLHEW